MKNTIMPDLRGYETFKIFVQLHVQNQYIRMIRNILFFFCWTCLFESWMNAPKKSSIACFNLVAFCVWTVREWMRLLLWRIVFMKSLPLSNSWRNMRSDHIRSRTSLLVEVDISDFSGIPDVRHRKRGRNNTKGMTFMVKVGKFHAAVEKQSY